MKIIVDDGACRGHGVCVARCPDVFSLTDGGYAKASSADIPTALRPAVTEAAATCPERAIHYSTEEQACH